MSTPNSSVFVALTTSVVPPAKLFDAFKNTKQILPLAAPKIVKSVDYVEGKGGPGTILEIVYVKGTWGKERVEFVDDQNYQYNYSVIDGAPLCDKFKKISAEIKIEAIEPVEGAPSGNMLNKVIAEIKPANNPDPASSVTLTGIYKTIDNNSVDPKDLRDFAKKALELLKLVETYVKKNSKK